MRILLTGAGGMVGKNFLEHPGIGGFDVLAPKRNDLDLRDFFAVREYLSKCRPDIVIHAAGKVGGIQANLREPVAFLLENLDMGRNIVWASREARVKRLINLGSSCMYPRNHTTPLSEELVLKGELEPTNEGYAIAKIVTARLCQFVSNEDPNFQYKTLIPCNLYGRHDKFDPANSHLLPSIIHKVHRAKSEGNATIEIWGDGTARREFMYAGDFADALVHSINEFETLPPVLNVGLGHDCTVNEYYQSVADVLGYSGTFAHDTTKPVGMKRKLLNVERQFSWGWKARSSLRIGIEKTVEFYLKELSV